MDEMDEGEITSAVQKLRQMEVSFIAPSHCTGQYATQHFQESWGHDFIPLGLGESFITEP